MVLVGLKGTDGKERNVRFFKNPLEAIIFLWEDKATSAARDNGAINLWVDDFGLYRASLHRHLITIEEITMTSLFDVRDLMKKWLKRIA